MRSMPTTVFGPVDRKGTRLPLPFGTNRPNAYVRMKLSAHIVVSILLLIYWVNLVESNPNITQSGLPLASDVANLTLLAYDILTRPMVRNLTDDVPVCIADSEFYSWCGGAFENPYVYCLYADHWPQENLTEWLQTTYFTPSANGSAYHKFPQYSSYCTCKTAGRAWFIPKVYVNYPTFTKDCPVEIAVLSLHLFLLVCYSVLTLFLIADIVLWLLLFFSKNRTFQFWGSFVPKLLLLLACLLSIVSITMLLVSSGYVATPNLFFGQIWAWALSIVFAVFSYLFWITTFFDMIFTVTNMHPTSGRLLSILRWLIVVFVVIPMFGVFVCAAIAYAFGQVTGVENYSLQELSDGYVKLLIVERVLATFSIVAMFICLIWGTCLVLRTVLWILQGEEFTKTNIEQEIFVYKTTYTVGATIFLWLMWGVQLAYTIIAAYSAGLDLSAYQSAMASIWLLFAEYFFMVFVLSFLFLAVKTHFSEGESYCRLFASSLSTITETQHSSGVGGSEARERH